MHNAILIARPFVTSGDSFADKQDPLTGGTLTISNLGFYTYS